MPRTSKQTIQLHRAQHSFRHSSAIYRGYVGGRGAGKSFIGAYDLLRRAEPGRLYGIYAPTYPLLRDATLRSMFEVGKSFNFIQRFNKAEGIIWLGNGAQIICRSLDDPENARGPNLSGAWIDEASLIARAGFDIVIACLREGGEQGWLSCTFTPKGKHHWTYDVFGAAKESTAIFHSSTKDNPFLPPEFEAMLRTQYTTSFAAQELGGEFIDAEGAMFSRSWFRIVPDYPRTCRLVRAWDMAASEPKRGTDPDWTVGVLLGLDAGQWYVIDVQRVQRKPRDTEALIAQTAWTDSQDVPIIMEQEPGSSGVGMIDHYRREVLPGFNFRGNKATGSKATRAMPFAAAAEAGNVMLVAGEWNKAFLDEAEAFPNGSHDDQIDAASLAMSQLAAHAVPHVCLSGEHEPRAAAKIRRRIEELFAQMSPAEKMAAMKLEQQLSRQEERANEIAV